LPGTPLLLRAINDRAALELLLDQGPLTRARLGELTGLSKVTASQLVERLERRQLIKKIGKENRGGGPHARPCPPGPRQTLSRLRPAEMAPRSARHAPGRPGPASDLRERREPGRCRR